MRNIATQRMDWYVSTTGNDNVGDGTLANPWKTPVGAYRFLQRNWDLGGIPGHIIHVSPGIYTSSFTAQGPIVGQSDVLIFLGDTSNYLNCILKPSGVADLDPNKSGVGYVAASIRGAMIFMDGFLFDQSYGHNDILVSAGQGGSLLAIGANCGFSNIYPRYNMATAYDTGKIQFEGGFKLYRRTTPPYDGDLPQCLFFAGVEGQIGFNNDAGNLFRPVLDLVGTPQFALCILYAYRGTIDAQGLQYSGTFGPCPDKLAHSGGVIQYLRSDPMPGTTTFAGGPAHSGGVIYDSYP